MMETEIFFYGASGCIVGAVGVISYLLGEAELAEVTELGERGYQRQQARQGGLFVLLEPMLRLMAKWVSIFPLGSTRVGIAKLLRQAGNYKGISPDEFISMSILSGIGGALMIGRFFFVPIPMLMFGGLTSLVPFLIVSGVRDKRGVAVTRALPSSIELIALCVSAGMDFPGALREVIGTEASEDDPLNSEFRQFLRDLNLGHSRRQALNAFDERVLGEGVGDFVAALIQSEEKGNPLKGVLQAQAKVLRLRRSFRAEEAATAAGVKMVIPLTLLLFGLLILIIAPLMIKMQEQGF